MSGTSGPRLSTIPFKDLNSFSFDGVDDYIDCGDNDNLSFGNGSTDSPFSISAWVKIDNISGFRILNKYVNTTYEYSLGTGGAGNLQFYLLDSSSQYRGRLQSSFLNTNQWYHVVATYSGVGGVNAQNGMKIYVDGVRVDDTTVSVGSYQAMNNTSVPVHIGRLNTSYTDGNIDEVAVFNTELSASDVTTIYNSGVPNDISSLSPLSWWRMGDNAIWNSQTWVIPNSGTDRGIVRSINMIEANRTTDVPPNPWTNTLSTYFDGIDDYVDCGDNDNLSFGDSVTDSPFSISAWIKVTTGTSFPIVAKYLAYPNGEYRFIKQADGTLLIRIISGNQELQRRGRTTNSIDSLVGQWVHVVTTYNGNSDYSGLKIYVNGVRSDVANNGKNAYTAMSNTSYPLEIGKLANTNIDEVSIFNTELSTSDITTIYNSGVPNDISSMSGLVSFWRMGDGSTYPTINDEIGSNDGTMTNMSSANFVTDVPTFSKKSIALDGVDDFVDMGNVLNFERLDTFSISAWVKKNDNGSGMMIVAKQETSVNYRGWMFYFDASNNLKFILRRQNQTYNRLIATSTNAISAGSWSHVVVTYDGSSTEAGFNFYINGADAGSNGAGSTLGGGTSLATTIPLQIGARNSSFSFFDGNIDEVSVFNTELSASDVTTIYNNGVPNDISSLSPVSWWRCGDGDTSPTLTDNGSGGNDGTMTNFTTFSTDVPT